MKTGLEAVKESVAKAKAQAEQSSAGWLNYFGWKDGDRKIIRFLTDEVITTEFYEYIMLNDGKGKSDFPYAPAIDPSFEDWVVKYGGQSIINNQLTDPQKRELTVGLAVLRGEEAVALDGRTVQRPCDTSEEIEIQDKKYQSRFYGIVKQSYRNFWGPIVGYYGRYGTICDRDYEITRSGSSTDTTYTIIPCDPVDDLRDAEAVQARYGYGKKQNADDPNRFLYCPMTLNEWIKDQASQSRAERLLVKKTEGGQSQQTPASQQPSETSGLSEFKQETTSNPEPDGGSLRQALLDNK